MSNDLQNYRPNHVLSVKIMVYGLAFSVCLSSVLSALAMVPAGSRAVVFNNFSGIEPLSLTEGMHLIIPFVEHPVLYDVRTQTYTRRNNCHDK